MSNAKEILDEINREGSTFDIIRKKHLSKLAGYTKRNTIAYYSGWLQKNSPDLTGILSVGDYDKNGLMAAVHKMDTVKGLDLILHTPGGDLAATESIIDYLTEKFDDIRVIVPQLAMSAGTIIACSADKILLGKHSSLGPIDPQFNGIPAHGILEEFKQAHEEIKSDQTKIAVWRPILEKYNPTILGECDKAIKWSERMVSENLENRMFKDLDAATRDPKIDSIIAELGDHSVNLSHSRHISARKCIEIGLEVEMIEDDQKLQNLILSTHHAFMHTFSGTPAVKIIENNLGVTLVQALQQQGPMIKQ